LLASTVTVISRHRPPPF